MRVPGVSLQRSYEKIKENVRQELNERYDKFSAGNSCSMQRGQSQAQTWIKEGLSANPIFRGGVSVCGA